MALSTVDVVEKVKEIVAPWKGKQGGLIPILQEVQRELGYLPEEALLTISRELKMPKAEVYGVATFYAQFHLKPKDAMLYVFCLHCLSRQGSLQILERSNDARN